MENQNVKENFIGKRDSTFETFIRSILKRSHLKEKYIKKMLDKEGLELYSNAFTHSSVDPNNNYEFLEILGDVTCNKIIVWYIKTRFPCLHNAAGVKVIARLRINLVSGKNFSLLCEKLGFTPFISACCETRELKMKSLLEDCFEAFFGATEILIDKICGTGSGYGICYRILKSILDEQTISLRYEDLYDPITRLKETFDYYRPNIPGRSCPLIWGNMLFENTRKESGQTIFLYQIDKNNNRKSLLSTATAPLLDEAKQIAAEQVLQWIEKQGYKKPIPSYYENLLQN